MRSLLTLPLWQGETWWVYHRSSLCSPRLGTITHPHSTPQPSHLGTITHLKGPPTISPNLTSAYDTLHPKRKAQATHQIG